MAVMYGGNTWRGERTNSLWEYDGQTWTPIQDGFDGVAITTTQQLYPASTVPIRYALVYNPDDKLVYLLGEAGSNLPLAIWTWNGRNWRQPYYGPIMGGEIAYRAVYDLARRKILLTRTQGGGHQSELLIYDPAKNTMTGPTVMQPPLESGVFAAFWVYDEFRKTSLWYQNDNGGFALPTTWAFDGTSWTKLEGESAKFYSNNNFAQAVYDPVRARSVAFGGGFFESKPFKADWGYYTGTWALPSDRLAPLRADGWQEVLPDGVPHDERSNGVSPPNTFEAETLVFDRHRRALIAPGYFDVPPACCAANPASWHTFEARYVDAVQIDAQPNAVLAQPGGTVTLSATAVGFGTLKYQWRHNEKNIRDGAGGTSVGGGTVSGATSSTLTIAGLTTSDWGSYDVVVSNDCGPLASRTVLLAFGRSRVLSNPVLAGGKVVIQFVAEPGITITIESAPTVQGPWEKKKNLTVPASGTVPFNEAMAPDQMRFYRAVYPAY